MFQPLVLRGNKDIGLKETPDAVQTLHLSAVCRYCTNHRTLNSIFYTKGAIWFCWKTLVYIYIYIHHINVPTGFTNIYILYIIYKLCICMIVFGCLTVFARFMPLFETSQSQVDYHHLSPYRWFFATKTPQTTPDSLMIGMLFLPSWWFQPIWKILVKLDHFPK